MTCPSPRSWGFAPMLGARITGHPLGDDADRALREPLRMHPEGVVEARAEVLDRDRCAQLDDLRVREVWPQAIELLVGDTSRRGGDRGRVVDDELRTLREGPALPVARQLEQLLLGDAVAKRDVGAEVHAPLTTHHRRGLQLPDGLDPSVDEMGAFYGRLEGSVSHHQPRVMSVHGHGREVPTVAAPR